jgi:hypothetical protein
LAAIKSRVKARPPFRCLREWRWTDEADLELELRDAAGTLLARLEHNRRRYRLTHPRTFPILSWADGERAKRRAESIALNALPPDPATRARVDRDNASGHPMGLPLSERICPTCRARPRNIKAADLGGKPLTVTIKSAAVEALNNPNGGGQQDKLLLSFVNQSKKLVCNVTNFNSIADLHGDETDNWPGKRIELYPTKASVGGKSFDAVRVRAPAQDALNDKIPF